MQASLYVQSCIQLSTGPGFGPLLSVYRWGLAFAESTSRILASPSLIRTQQQKTRKEQGDDRTRKSRTQNQHQRQSARLLLITWLSFALVSMPLYFFQSTLIAFTFVCLLLFPLYLICRRSMYFPLSLLRASPFHCSLATKTRIRCLSSIFPPAAQACARGFGVSPKYELIRVADTTDTVTAVMISSTQHKIFYRASPSRLLADTTSYM